VSAQEANWHGTDDRCRSRRLRAEQGTGEVGIGDVGPAEAGDHLAHGVVVADEVLDVVGDPAAGDPGEGNGAAPADEAAALQALGEPEPRSRPKTSMISPPVSFGHRLTSPGTYASRRCRATASRHGSPPSSRASPASGRSRPSSTRIVVVLPAPWGPTNPCTSPAVTVRSSPSRAWVGPNVFTSPDTEIATAARERPREFPRRRTWRHDPLGSPGSGRSGRTRKTGTWSAIRANSSSGARRSTGRCGRAPGARAR